MFYYFVWFCVFYTLYRLSRLIIRYSYRIVYPMICRLLRFIRWTNIDEIELINDLATPSDVQLLATPSDFDFGGIQPLAAYNRPYDGSMSSSVINYFDDIVQKLGGVHYVFFRSGQYSYRLIYGKDMSLSGSYFSGSECSYYAYDTRYYTWQHGVEGSFSLDAESYLVYSDLGAYPALASGSIAGWLIAFCMVLYLLFVILRALFAPQRMRY